jgi:hypothetical protein
MKIDQNVAAVLLMGFADGTLRNPPSITSGNRIHIERARPGSPEEAERMAAAEAKRQRKLKR